MKAKPMWRKVLSVIGLAVLAPPVLTLGFWLVQILVGKITGAHSPMEQFGPGLIRVWVGWQIATLLIIVRGLYLYWPPSGDADLRNRHEDEV